MKAAALRSLFADLRAQLVPLAQAIMAQQPADDSCLRHHYPGDPQLKFGLAERLVRL